MSLRVAQSLCKRIKVLDIRSLCPNFSYPTPQTARDLVVTINQNTWPKEEEEERRLRMFFHHLYN